MAYGFEANGTSGRLIINDYTPILTQMFWGNITVNVLVPDNQEQATYGDNFPVSYGYCDVTYSVPVTSQVPPLVFAVPTQWVTTAGLGNFVHRGSPGAWTGFSIIVTRDVMCTEWWYMNDSVNWDTGWEYRVCGFGQAGDAGYDEYGMRIWGPTGAIIYDSAWPVVRFKGLLSAWAMQGYTDFYEIYTYWGDRETDNVDLEFVLAKGTHTWGYADWSTGFLLSGLGTIAAAVDRGDQDAIFNATVLFGFANAADRSTLHAVAVLGKAQHPYGDVSALNQWKILTADFTAT